MHSVISRAVGLTVFAALILSTLAGSARAAVVIIANRTQSAIRFESQPHRPGALQARSPSALPTQKSRTTLTLNLDIPDSSWRRQMIDGGDCIAVPLDSSEVLSVRGAAIGTYELAPYGMYYFGSTATGRLELREIGLETPAVAQPAAQGLIGAQGDLRRTAADNGKQPEAASAITVAIFVDEEEPAVEQLWQKRLQDRVAEASKILERSCGVKLAVKSFGRWESDDAVHDFALSLREFERKVQPKDAHVAIGFTSQYQITRGRTHLGGTHGPLQPHILLREWSQHVSESERLELLLHELGHFLGAVHSPERNSVMRPVLGDRQARARAFRIAIDPVNALAMNVVSEEIRDRGVTSFWQLSEPARLRLEAIYATLAKAMPDDPAAAAYLQYVRRRHVVP